MKTKKFLRKKLSLWLKSLLLMTGLALLTPDCIFGQAALPFSYDGGGTSLSMGLTASGLGSDYSSSPKMKFDNSSDYLILNFNEAPGALSFDIKWNRSSTTASRFPGTFTLYESDSGSTYTVVQTYNSTSGTALTNAKVVSESFITLKSTTRYIKWEYTNKEDGNIGIGNIRLDKFIPVYTIQYSINGSISIEKSYVREGSAIDNFPIIPTKSDCDGNKVFVGWIEQPISENTDVVPFFITEKYFPEGDKTLYAVFATGNIAEYDEWRAINDVSEVTEGTYVITFEHDDKRGVYFYLPSETIADKNPIAKEDLTIEDGKLTNTVSSEMQWDFTGNNTEGFTISHTNGTDNYYLTSTNAAQGISVTSSTTTTWKAEKKDDTNGILLKGSDTDTRYLAVFHSESNATSWRYYMADSNYKGKLTLYKKIRAIIYSHYITNCGVTWSGSSGESWDTETNWTPNQVPTEATDVIIPKTSVYPEIPENTTVKTITFKHGAEIGNQQNLTITGKAFIELDLAPGRWHLLSMPVAAISRDFYFEEGPSSWIRTFITTAGNANKAGWKYITNLDKTFEIGDGFAFWVGTKEDTENQKITLEGTVLSNGSETKSLDFGEDSGSYFALAGNPFMTTVDFDKLAENNTSIVNSYLIWTEEGGFSGYNKSGTFGISGGLTEHIAPLQSFIVEKTSESSPVTLNFDLEKIQATGSGELKADEKTAGNKLDIIASNPAASVLTFIANREDGQSSRKLFSTMSNLPDIYTLNGTTALGANIIHTGDILVPVGLATAYTGNMNLTFKGMDNYDARISFLDVVADREIDITGLSVYEYSFNYTPKKENDQVVAEENRFFVRIQPSSTGLTNHLSGEAFVYSKDHVVFAVSGFSDLIQKIRIYNTQGLLIYADDNIKAPSYTVNCSVNIPEICIVKLITEQGTKSVKLLVK